jgi:DNA mismatch repair ATPase MutS
VLLTIICQTMYIKQVALIVIMAQIGCFVPARHATIPVRDRILCRLGSSDDLEHNMSTFQIEMKEIAKVLDMVTDNSLIVIDELGRGTSNVDGLALAFAIAENLMDTKAYTFFVTHYSQV